MASQRRIVFNIHTEAVIRAVSARPVLWDPSHRSYKDAETRLAAWRGVCEEMIADFDAHDRHVKQAAVKKIQQRWRNARDCYKKTKSALKQSKGGKVKMYVNFDLMTFLDRSSEEQEEQSGDSDEEATDPLLQEKETRIQERDVRPGQKKKLDEIQPEYEPEVLDVSKRSIRESMPDEDWSFFNSLMPTLNHFSNLQKLMFRSKVLNFLIEVERSNVSSNAEADVECSTSNVKFEF